MFSANEPDQLRGPQHEAAWSDEVASWPYVEAWDNLQLGLRSGERPRQVVTTTPKPLRILRELVAAAGRDVVLTRGTTYENRANLAPTFFRQIIRRYEGTTLGRQELRGELLEDVPGALWKRAMLDEQRVSPDRVPELQRITRNDRTAMLPPVVGRICTRVNCWKWERIRGAARGNTRDRATQFVRRLSLWMEMGPKLAQALSVICNGSWVRRLDS